MSEENKIQSLKAQLQIANELILDLFIQGASVHNGYDHCCISAYEEAQDYLLLLGLIKEEECIRRKRNE